jgi:hypothetical protein
LLCDLGTIVRFFDRLLHKNAPASIAKSKQAPPIAMAAITPIDRPTFLVGEVDGKEN